MDMTDEDVDMSHLSEGDHIRMNAGILIGGDEVYIVDIPSMSENEILSIHKRTLELIEEQPWNERLRRVLTVTNAELLYRMMMDRNS